MKREEAITIIKRTFPPETERGMDLLAQAKSEIKGLEAEPTPVLIRYAELCEKNHKIKILSEGSELTTKNCKRRVN